METTMPRRLVLLITLAAGMAIPAAAHAGGWATVGLSSPPDGAQKGKPWVVDLTVLQHGRTPLVGVKPKVEIRRGAERVEFVAVPTARDGVYRARVTFPAAGRWRYAVDDGFSAKHAFGSVDVGDGGGTSVLANAMPAPQRPASDGPDMAIALGAAGGAGVLGGLLTLLLRRRRESGTSLPSGG
jgi:hypothetical protein